MNTNHRKRRRMLVPPDGATTNGWDALDTTAPPKYGLIFGVSTGGALRFGCERCCRFTIPAQCEPQPTADGWYSFSPSDEEPPLFVVYAIRGSVDDLDTADRIVVELMPNQVNYHCRHCDEQDTCDHVEQAVTAISARAQA